MQLPREHYGQPAGICVDQPHTWALGAVEKKIVRVTRLNPRRIAENLFLKKELKSWAQGAFLVEHLVRAGQRPPLLQILGYLDWLNTATLLIALGPGSNGLLNSLIAESLRKIFLTSDYSHQRDCRNALCRLSIAQPNRLEEQLRRILAGSKNVGEILYKEHK